MKKFISLVAAVAVVLSSSVFAAEAVGDGDPGNVASEPVVISQNANGEIDGVTVKIDGKVVEFDQEPIIINDRTMVPLRAIFEELGAVVTWETETNTAIAFKEDTTVSVQINNNRMFKNSEIIELDVAPMLVSDRTLVPVRAVSEAFECDVEWNEENLEVIITTNKDEETVVDGEENAEISDNGEELDAEEK